MTGGLAHADPPVSELTPDSEALDFRVTSESSAPFRKLGRLDLERCASRTPESRPGGSR